MKKLFKGIVCLAVLSLLMGGIVTVFNACQNNLEETDLDTSEASSFLDYMDGNLDAVLSTDVSGQSLTRSGRIIEPKDQLVIYADFPEETEQLYIEKCSTVKCVNDILKIQHATAAEFTLEKIPNCAIKLSETELRKANVDLLRESKEFLYKRGFTEEELQEMIAEEGSDELSLIPLVALVSACENHNVSLASNNLNKFNPLDLFFTPANAKDWSDLTQDDVIHCVKHAVGIDIFYGLNFSGTTQWRKWVIKKLFKTVVKRICGPVGALIMLGDFYFCADGL